MGGNIWVTIMAHKQFMKMSEAKILLYLDNVSPNLRYAAAISTKLGIDYKYCIQMLKAMAYKKWLDIHRFGGRTFYKTNKQTPIQEATKVHQRGAQLELKE